MASWHNTLGFKSYPLDPRSNINLVGTDDVEKRIRTYLLQGNMCLISGPTGSGKTSMLKRLASAEDLQHFRFIYISADGIKADYNISDAINEDKSFFQKLFMSKPKNLVILLDECQLATRILTESIKSKWNFVYPDGTKCIHSVIVCQIENRLSTNFSGSFQDRLGKRVITMPKLTESQMVEVLAKRLDNGKRNYIDSFSKEALDFLTVNASGSVRQLLEYTDAIFRLHNNFMKNPLKDAEYKIAKEAVFNSLQQAEVVVEEEKDDSIKELMQRIEGSSRYKNAVEMYEQFGTLSNIALAEKLDTSKQNADSIIRQLKKWNALVLSHEDDDTKHYVLSPRLQHELIKA